MLIQMLGGLLDQSINAPAKYFLTEYYVLTSQYLTSC